MAEAGSKCLSFADAGLTAPEPEGAGVNGGVCMDDAGGECLGVGRPDCGWLELFEGTWQSLAVDYRVRDTKFMSSLDHLKFMR